MFNKILKYFYMSAQLFILFMANLLIINSFVFLIKGSINNFYTLITFLISITELCYLNKKEKWKLTIPVIITIITFIVATSFSGFVYDTSYDGNSYHKEAIGLLKNGWNPIYEESKEFAKTIGINSQQARWVEHYPKATWIIGASIYRVTNNIESAKAYNAIIIFSVFFIIAYLINKFYNKKILSLIMATAISIFPIMCQQIFSFYVDGFMGFILFLITIFMYLIIKEKENNEYLWMIGPLIIIIINIKYSGLLYGGLFCLGYYLYYFIKKIRQKEIKDIIGLSAKFVAIVLVSLLLVGSNSYVKNLVDHKHPLYPLMGEGKSDIMVGLQPSSFDNMSAIEKNFYSLFSKTANIGAFNDREPELKVPFAVQYDELLEYGEDTRIGGYGVLFSGIFIVSLIVLIVALIIAIKNKKIKEILKYGIPIITTILIMFIISDSWWARYSPQLFMLPLIAMFILLNNKKKIIKALGLILFALIFANSFITGGSIFKAKVPQSGYIRMTYEEYENQNVKIKMLDPWWSGIYYNFDDHNIEYEIVDNLEESKDLYRWYVLIEVKK